WERIRQDGFDVKVFERNIRNKEKGVDIEMAMDIADRLHEVQPPGILVIASGDADYIPAIDRARRRDWKVEVWFWENAADALKKSASCRFVSIDHKFEFLRLSGH